MKNCCFSRSARRLPIVTAVVVTITVALFAAGGGPIGAYAASSGADGNGLPYAEAFDKRADPRTSNVAADLAPSTRDDGRLFTDKTVDADRAVIYDVFGKEADAVAAGADEFLITLSALSQSYKTDVIVEPSDTVFVLDVSASMYLNKLDNGVSRVEAMVNALNEAIQTLMDGNPNNRIAVVAFGGDSGKSRICPILKLDRYSVKDGQFFSMRSAAYIQVNSQIPNSSLIDESYRNIRVYGGTSTQHGIYAGAKLLLERNDTAYTYVENGRAITVTRKPNIVLLSDGGATMGWTDYKFAKPESDSEDGYDRGDANTSDLGISTLTVLTAAYFKQQVRDHYYGEAEPGGTAGFYTIGLSIGGTGYDAPAVLDPANNAINVSRIYNKVTYNMQSLLDDFVNLPGGEIEFPALNYGSSGVRSIVAVKNDNNYVKSYDYTDGYYSAEQEGELTGAFQSIVQRITSSGNYITQVTFDENYSGYLVFSDVLGEFMSFKDFHGLWNDNRKYDGHLFAKSITTPGGSALRDRFIDTMLIHQAYFGLTDEAAAKAKAVALLDSCIAAGKKGNDGLYYNNDGDFSSKIKYYADEQRWFVDNYFDANGDPFPLPPSGAKCIIEMYTVEGAALNQISGESADLMSAAFHVITALADDDFKCVYSDGIELVNHLKAGQQAVRWYIPASLIPIRAVTPKYDETGLTVVSMQVREAPPVRVIYGVGLRDDFSYDDMDIDYKIANPVASENAYYFYTNEWDLPENHSMAYFPPAEDNPYYYYSVFDTDETGRVPLYVAGGGGYVKASGVVSGGGAYYTLHSFLDANEPGFAGREYIKVENAIIASLAGGEPYIDVGTAKNSAAGSGIMTDNYTETDDYAVEKSDISVGAGADFMRLAVQSFGNNGRLKIPFTEVTAEKSWYKDSPELFTPKTEYIQLYMNDIPVGDPVAFIYNINDEYEHTWENLPTYDLTADADGNASFNVYTVAEGTWSGGIFTPYNNSDYLSTGFRVFYMQPEWDEDINEWDYAQIVNYAHKYAWFLNIEKIVKGDIPAWETGGADIEFDIYHGGSTIIPSVKYTDKSKFTDGKAYLYIENSDATPYDFTVKETLIGASDYSYSVDIEYDYSDVDYTSGNAEIILKNVTPDKTINLTFTNTYEDTNVADLTIVKEFPNGYPAGGFDDIAIEVVGDDQQGNEFFRDTIYYPDDFTNSAYTFLKLKPGLYTITELGGEAYGYSMTVTTPADSGAIMQLNDKTFAVDIERGDDKTVILDNRYVKNAGLTIEKIIRNLDISHFPDDIIFYVAGPAVVDKPQYERYIEIGEFTGNSYRLENVPPGVYTIEESGGAIGGYILSSTEKQTVTIGNSDVAVTFENNYMPILDLDSVRPSLTLMKLFDGISRNMYPDNISFAISGKDDNGAVFYTEIINGGEFTVNSDGDMVYKLDSLYPGSYTITENGGFVRGYAFAVNHTDGYSLPVRYSENETVIFANTYSPMQADMSAGLTIKKSFVGLPAGAYPDAAFRIVGENTAGARIFDEIINYSEFIDGSYRVGLVPPGSYTITESGAEKPDYYLDAAPSLGHALNLNAGDDIEVTFTNTYREYSGGDPVRRSPAGNNGPVAPAQPAGESQTEDGKDNDNADTPINYFTEDHIWYIRGYEDNTMRPETSITRAEVSMAFFRLLAPDLKTEPPDAGFSDVRADEWYGLAINTLARYGILNGYPDGSFKPDLPITRSELAAVVSRFEHLEKTDSNPYEDVDAGHWAYEYILSATEKGWFIGDGAAKFRPDDAITRAEFVTVANRVLKRCIAPADIPEGLHVFGDIDASHWSYAAFTEAIYSHEYEYKPDGINEIWTKITGDGILAPYNR